MRWIALGFVAAATLGRLAVAAEETLSSTIASVPHCVVAPADQADMPPLEAGVIASLSVVEGTRVEEKQILLQLDDRKAMREQEVADAKYGAAKTKAEAADINVEYAIAAKAVADAEFKVNVEANANVPGSVPLVRINELRLKCIETELAIKKAKSDKGVAGEEANVAKAELEAAKVMVERHKLVSPLSGEVTDVRAHKGEAVQPTQPVIRVIRLDSVWVEGYVPAAKFARGKLAGQPARVSFHITGGEKKSLDGKVIFVKPLTDTGDTYLVRAKVDNTKLPNGSWELYPGMQAEMSIQLGQ